MPLDTLSPEAAYCTKPNILVPKTDPRTVATIQSTALSQLQDGYGSKHTVSAVALPSKEA